MSEWIGDKYLSSVDVDDIGLNIVMYLNSDWVWVVVDSVMATDLYGKQVYISQQIMYIVSVNKV